MVRGRIIWGDQPVGGQMSGPEWLAARSVDFTPRFNLSGYAVGGFGGGNHQRQANQPHTPHRNLSCIRFRAAQNQSGGDAVRSGASTDGIGPAHHRKATADPAESGANPAGHSFTYFEEAAA